MRLGHILMEDALEIARKTEGCYRVALLVEKAKERLRDYYAQLGFKVETEVATFGSRFYKMTLVL